MKIEAKNPFSGKSMVKSASTLGGVTAGYSVARLADNKLPGKLNTPIAEGAIVVGSLVVLPMIKGSGPVVDAVKAVPLGIAFWGANKLIQRGASMVMASRDQDAVEEATSGNKSMNASVKDILAAGIADNYYPADVLTLPAVQNAKIPVRKLATGNAEAIRSANGAVNWGKVMAA